VKHELNFCNRCGGDLSFLKGRVGGESRKSREESVAADMFSMTVIGLGLILGGVVALKALYLNEALIIAYMMISSLAFIGIYSLRFWRIVHTRRGGSQTSGVATATTTAQAENLVTRELEDASPGALPEPSPSITEGTTRAFEPSYRERKGR
jgi:hypothetical protein